MQLTSTTDYAIRIISYLTEKNGSASANELSDELNIPNSYIPKIIKNLKNIFLYPLGFRQRFVLSPFWSF